MEIMIVCTWEVEGGGIFIEIYLSYTYQIAFFCYALNDKSSFEYLKEKIPNWLKYKETKANVFFVGLKDDHLEKNVDKNEVLDFIKMIESEYQGNLDGKVENFEISSKTNSGVSELFLLAHQNWKELEEKKEKKAKRKCIIN